MWFNTLVIVIILLVGLANLFLAIYVYRKNPKEKTNISFFYFGLACFLWSLSTGLSLIFKNLFWIKATYAAGSIVPLAGIFLTSALADKKLKTRTKVFLLAIGAIAFAVILFTPFFVKSITYFTDFGFVAVFGPLFNIWSLYLLSMAAIAFFSPFIALNKVDEQRRKQILYFMTGVAIFAVWTIIIAIILPFLGATKLIALNSIATIFLVGFTSYSIIKYHLMNISSLLFQAFIYSLVIVIIITSLLTLVFVSSFLFEHLLIWPIYIMVALVSVILFFIGRLFFIEKRDLEKSKINLTESLEKSEENRTRAELERDKTSIIISSFSDGLIILDEKNEIFSINPEAKKILGLETNRLLGKSLKSLANFPKAVPVASVLNSGLKNISKKQVELAKDFIIELSVIPLNLDENDIGHLIVLHDVSREKMVESMKSEFVSLAAHQLRTPLSIIKWSLSMLKGGDFGKLTKKQSEIIKSTFQNNERQIYLVNDLLNVTRIEEGRYLYKVSMADMEEIINFVIDSYKDEIKKRKIEVNFEKSDNLPQIMLDTEKMKLALQNLIDNAIKYSPEGGKIIITLRRNGENIEFKIKDFGIGIPKNQQDKIFTKFFRSDNAAKVNTVGSGLGLFIVQNIIEAHGGKIWFDSEENVGTSFYFSLPIKRSGV